MGRLTSLLKSVLIEVNTKLGKNATTFRSDSWLNGERTNTAFVPYRHRTASVRFSHARRTIFERLAYRSRPFLDQ
jgi:hypothetical protein